MSLYVQYGCGFCAPPTWKNFDASLTPRLQRLPLIGRSFTNQGTMVFPKNVEYGDIVKGLPIGKNSCDGIYCSHVLEHLALSDLHTALANTFTYLKPGGVFRFVLPDLEQLCREYLASDDTNASSQFMENAHLGQKQRPRKMNGFLRDWIGNSRHLWMWDYKGLAEEMKSAGFTSVRRAVFGDSQDARFSEVEEYGRWKEREMDCLGMECIK